MGSIQAKSLCKGALSRSREVETEEELRIYLIERGNRSNVKSFRDLAFIYGEIIVVGGASFTDSILDLVVVSSLWKSGHRGMASVLLVIVWLPGVVVWGFLRAHGLASCKSFLLALSGLKPLIEVHSSLRLGEQTAGMVWYTISEGVIEAPLSSALTLYGITIEAVPVTWYTVASFAWSLITVARTLLKVDFYGQQPALGAKLARFSHRLIETGWRVLSLALIAVLLRDPTADLMEQAQFMIFPILIVDFVVSVELAGLIASNLNLAVRLLIAAMMVTASPPLFLPSANFIAPAYARIRGAYTVLLGAMITYCWQGCDDFAQHARSLLESWPSVVAAALCFGSLHLLTMPLRLECWQCRADDANANLTHRLQQLNSALVAAIRSCDVILMGILVGEGADLEKVEMNGFSAMHLIVLHFDKHVANYALKHGASVTCRDAQGDTALSLAVRIGDMDTVQWLIRNARDALHNYPLLSLTGLNFPSHSDCKLQLGGDKYAGIAQGADGKLYCAPLDANHVLVIDPSANLLSFWSADGSEQLKGKKKYNGIALGVDGKLYCAPRDAADVLVMDPSSSTLSFLHAEGLDIGGDKYFGIASGVDGKLYCAPRSAAEILVIDPTNGTLSFLSADGLEARGDKYFGIASGPDGKLYCAPHDASDVLVVDPRTGKASTIRTEGLQDRGKYCGIATGVDGKLYCAPYHATEVLVIDPSTGTLHFLRAKGLEARGKYCGVSQGADGRLYCAPRDAADVLVVDPTSGTLSFLNAAGLEVGGDKYFDIAPGIDDKLYCAPRDASDVLIVDPVKASLLQVVHKEVEPSRAAQLLLA